jgi:hypothetical protein
VIDISRRDFAAGLSAAALFPPSQAFADADQQRFNGRIAIVDTSDDASDYAERLRQANVAVVARYYARGFQESVPNKRIAFNSLARSKKHKGAPEIDRLLENQLAILSVYQYQSNKPQKFLFGLSGKGLTPSQAARAEAEADAKAANDQAGEIKQSSNAPIYFGLDFDLIEKAKYATYSENGNTYTVYDPSTKKPVENRVLIDACHTYFETLGKEVGYPLGVYGNGFANRYLRKNNLVRYSWVSESRSYDQTAEFLSDSKVEDRWHLFQHHIDRRWFVDTKGCTSAADNGFDVDGNVQNPTYASIGAWNRDGLVSIEPTRTLQIFNERRVAQASPGAPVYKSKDGGEPTDTRRCTSTGDDPPKWHFVSETTVGRNRAARVLAEEGNWLLVDINEDGAPDGYCRKADFVKSIKEMPPW